MTDQDCYLFKEDKSPGQARFPVIDAHNHFWGAWKNLDERVRVMDTVGVRISADLTPNLTIAFKEGGYAFEESDIQKFFDECDACCPGRFFCFTCATFTKPKDQPLFSDAAAFAEETAAVLQQHVERGARGLKILKEFGLHYHDADGNLIRFDDERLIPIWRKAAELGVPVLTHQSDPYGFFKPVTEQNEHYDSLNKYPSWSFADPAFPSKKDLLDRRDRVIARHPKTTFILPHVANFPENLKYVAGLLDKNPNVYIDISARIDELGRQPYRTREFLINYQDRVLFGTDMPVSDEMYRCYFRFLETWDEYFIPPDYDGTFERFRWRIYGLGLPDEVLQKMYYANAQKVIPGLAADL